MDFEQIRINLRKRINHQNEWDKHVSILSEVQTGYDVLRWEYNNHKVEARSKDTNLLLALKETIEMYLEEVENE